MTPATGFQPVSAELNDLSRVILDCAFKVHKTLGPGLLETTYRLCMVHELEKQGISVKQELMLPIVHDGVAMEGSYRIDLLVADLVVVE